MPVRRLPLSPESLAELRASTLEDDTIRSALIYTENDSTKLAHLLGYKEAPLFSGGALVFPHFDLDGNKNCYATVKPHQPRINKDGKPIKYETPCKTYRPKQAYVGPASRKRIKAGVGNIIFVEGIKKALALEQLGYPVVGLSGVYCWKPEAEEKLLPDLEAVGWQGRKVFICFDYDPKPTTQANVAMAARRLGACLLKAGAAEVRVTALPAGPGNAKSGIDDHLASFPPEKREAVVRALLDAAKGLADHFSNYTDVTRRNDKGEDSKIKVGKTSATMQRELHDLTNGWPKRTGELLFARQGDDPIWLLKTADLFAWIGAQLPKPIQWADGQDKVSEVVFHAHLKQNAECFAAVETLPHFPPLHGHYYMHPPVTGNGEHLQALLGRFRPATPVDRMLLKALLMTPFWGGPPGARPCFLIEADGEVDNGGRGVGKTTVAKGMARLAGGHIDIRQTDDFTKTTTRMLTPTVLTKRIALLDNVKSLRFSWADLEGLVTGPQINGHQLYTGDATRPNTLTFIVTMNGASMSKDMAGRSIPIRLARPEYRGGWEEETNRFIDEHRWEIIGDIISELARDKKSLEKTSRWGAWEAAVLACVDDPAACQELIAERQTAIDSDDEESNTVRDGIAEALRRRGHDPDQGVVFLPSGDLAKIVNEATGEKRATNKATAYLKTLNIAELSKVDRTDLGGRGWLWSGKEGELGEGLAWAPGLHGERVTINTLSQMMEEMEGMPDQIICAYNSTRVGINRDAREYLGYPPNRPVVGDRVMCLQNDHHIGVFNGMQGTIKSLVGDEMVFTADGKDYRVRFDPTRFNLERAPEGYKRRGQIPFDYAYAVTGHKAQGDEWDNVLVLEQRCRQWEHARWAYTAASRARQKLRWVTL